MIAATLGFVPAGFAQPLPAESTPARTFSNKQYHFTVAFPDGCRYEEGPGTVDAICSADFNSERSIRIESARALVMEVGAEALSAGASRSASYARYSNSEPAFREELPQAVCGESEPSRARVQAIEQAAEGERIVYTAELICAEVRFLQISERRASVRYILAPDVRYRLIARAPVEDFDKHKQAIAAFFDGFRILPAEGKEPQ